MILKTAANYNDEGGYIEAWKNSDGTTEVKLIPKSGGDDGKNGILSVTISPAITTTPALDSMFPIYWEDLTDGEKELGKEISIKLAAPLEQAQPATVTVEPTADWYAFSQDTEEYGSQGESVQNTTGFIFDSGKYTMDTTLVAASANDDTGETVTVYLKIDDR